MITVDSYQFKADQIELPHCRLLLIQGSKGLLGCGYVSIEAAEKFGDALAIVTGVNSYEDMLNAEVKKVSTQAAALGVRVGMSGKEALLLMR